MLDNFGTCEIPDWFSKALVSGTLIVSLITERSAADLLLEICNIKLVIRPNIEKREYGIYQVGAQWVQSSFVFNGFIEFKTH